MTAPTVTELSEFPRLARMTPAELGMLAQAGRVVTYAPGERLLTEGAIAEHCWLICEGHIQLDAHLPGRGDLVIQTLSRGDLLGWSWLVPPYRWQFGARALGPVTAIQFGARLLADIADRHPTFGRALNTILMETLVDRLQATRARLLDLYRNPDER